MGYREQLQQAREILHSEIAELQRKLAAKEQDLRKLDSLLKESGSQRGSGPSLTSQIVEALYLLAQESLTVCREGCCPDLQMRESE